MGCELTKGLRGEGAPLRPVDTPVDALVPEGPGMGSLVEVVFGRGANRLGTKRELFEDAALAGVAVEDLSLVFALLGTKDAIDDGSVAVLQKRFGFEAGGTGMI